MDSDEAVRLRRVVMRLARTFNAGATDEDLTPTQASVLGLLATRGPLAISAVAALENINPSMMSRVVGKLDARGLISRTPDPNDLRAATVSISRSGRAVQSRVKNRRAAAIQHAAEGLTPEQHAALVAALPALEALAPRHEA
ncbi:MarR family winged helix-turn-helix transcriptional regulator [Jatrophihabitans endophyticus]|uniref:MarR family winged helix-turn-helix transcriptional regulator n=1 Tax=Jatrophihabitans endophyticus TaxID=1206085 RepID=UPI0019FBB09E|nr:MarR family transcriptional regulator [Jatrophihabitans endophyticus]MBE7188222.1 MarR family transcriptional regulator [Jatrophihabitans endophyticus]